MKQKNMWLGFKNKNWQERIKKKNKGDELKWWAASVHRRQVRGEVVFFIRGSRNKRAEGSAQFAASPPSVCVHVPAWRPRAGPHF